MRRRRRTMPWLMRSNQRYRFTALTTLKHISCAVSQCWVTRRARCSAAVSVAQAWYKRYRTIVANRRAAVARWREDRKQSRQRELEERVCRYAVHDCVQSLAVWLL